MNEYLYEVAVPSNLTEVHLTDEEMIYVIANEKLHSNRRKRFQKEKMEYGKESDYDFYC